MRKKIINVFGKELIKIQVSCKRLIFKKIILKISRDNNSIINFLNIIFKIKFKVNLKDQSVYDKTGNKIYYSYLHRNMFFVNGIERRFNDLTTQYLTENIDFKKGGLVIDCGANIGEFSLALSKKNPKLKFICFEPEEKEFSVLKKNLKKINAHLYNSALSNKDGVMKFYSNNESGDSSLFETKNSAQKAIKGLKLSSIFKEQNIDHCLLLKLEAEGAEPEIIEGAESILNLIQYISVDCGPERGLSQERTIQAVHKLLKYKFDLVDFSKTRDVLLFKNAQF